MTFLQLLNSLDELLFEVLSWFIFFPVTLAKVLARPLRMMDYAQGELALPTDKQFATAVAPPLFLLLCLLIAHGVELGLGERSAIIDRTSGLSALVSDHTSLLVLRLIFFGLFATLMAALSIAARRLPLAREQLMPAFYAQCYPVGAMALFVSLGADFAFSGEPALAGVGAAVGWLAALNYLICEMRWFRRALGGRWIAASMWTLLGTMLSIGMALAVGLAFT